MPGELLQHFLGLFADNRWQCDLYLNELISVNSTGSQAGGTTLSQSEPLARLSAWGNPQQGFSIDGWHLDLCAEGRLRYGDWHGAVDVVALSPKIRVVTNIGDDVKIAGLSAEATRVSLAGNPHARAFVDARRYSDVHRLVSGYNPAPSARLARSRDFA